MLRNPKNRANSIWRMSLLFFYLLILPFLVKSQPYVVGDKDDIKPSVGVINYFMESSPLGIALRGGRVVFCCPNV